MDNKDKLLKLRIEKNEYDLLKYVALKCNMDVSKYVRMLITTATIPVKRQIQTGEMSYADIETFFDNKLQYDRIFKGKA